MLRRNAESLSLVKVQLVKHKLSLYTFLVGIALVTVAGDAESDARISAQRRPNIYGQWHGTSHTGLRDFEVRLKRRPGSRKRFRGEGTIWDFCLERMETSPARGSIEENRRFKMTVGETWFIGRVSEDGNTIAGEVYSETCNGFRSDIFEMQRAESAE
jgi:hypothetical protein